MVIIDVRDDPGDPGDPPGPYGPSDRELVEALQRMASARAHLAHAEAQSRAGAVPRTPATTPAGPARHPDIDAARADVLWAQAAVLTAPVTDKASSRLAAALSAQREALARHGFRSLADYRRHQPSSTTPPELHLRWAQREFDAAREAWRALQSALDRGAAPPG